MSVGIDTSAGTVPGLVNVLPWATASHEFSDPGVLYVGEGLPPLIVHRIVEWKFVDMAELLPEYWALLRGEDESKKAAVRRPKQVTDFHTRLQCFALYCGVLGKHNPSAIPEIMAYLVTISRMSQDFSGLAWVRYDSAFRRNAAATGNRKWSAINPTYYLFFLYYR